MSWVNKSGEQIPTPRKEVATQIDDQRLITTVMLALRNQGWSNLKISRHMRYDHEQVERRLKRAPSTLGVNIG